MTRWVRLENNIVQEVLEFNPKGLFHPSLSFMTTEETVAPGYIHNPQSGEFSAPEAPEVVSNPVIPKRTTVSPIEFKLLFTLNERLAITAARNAPANSNSNVLLVKAALNDWFSIVDDPRLTEIRLDGPTVLEGAEFLVQIGILTQERANTILAGI